MKKNFIHVATTVTALLSSLVTVHAENIVSRPVGVMQIKVPEDAFSLVSLPFQPFTNSIHGVLADQLTGATNEEAADRVYKWDAAVSEYLRAAKADGTGNSGIDGRWVTDFTVLSNSDLTLSPGEGFFIENRQGATQSVYLAGKIVLDATNTIILYPGLNLVGYPFSSAGSLPMGQGQWAANTTDVADVWAEVRPYDDVFPADDNPPQITGISVGSTADSKEVTLSIRCAGETMDIFYKDLTPTSRLDAANGWELAAADIDVRGKADVEWTDRGNSNRPSVSGVFARYFLAAAASVDSDNDGVPDAREQFVFGTDPHRVPGSFGATPFLVQTEDGTSAIHGISGEEGAISNAVPASPMPQIIHGRIIYVDRQAGDNVLSGRSAVAVGVDGPKKTIRAGLQAATVGDTVFVKSGNYGEDINIAGRAVSVRIGGNVNLSGRSVAMPEAQGIPPMTNSPGAATNGF